MAVSTALPPDSGDRTAKRELSVPREPFLEVTVRGNMCRLVGLLGLASAILAAGYAVRAERLRRDAVERENVLYFEMQSKDHAWRHGKLELHEAEERINRMYEERRECKQRRNKPRPSTQTGPLP